jgi:hypothetical protein
VSDKSQKMSGNKNALSDLTFVVLRCYALVDAKQKTTAEQHCSCLPLCGCRIFCFKWGSRPKPHNSLRSLVATRCFKSLGFRYAPVVFLRATQKRRVLNRASCAALHPFGGCASRFFRTHFRLCLQLKQGCFALFLCASPKRQRIKSANRPRQRNTSLYCTSRSRIARLAFSGKSCKPSMAARNRHPCPLRPASAVFNKPGGWFRRCCPSVHRANPQLVRVSAIRPCIAQAAPELLTSSFRVSPASHPWPHATGIPARCAQRP